ncbi:unnamed protein product [Acanthoscelides obtectus]|uniref:Uncharacterized protein n=1 Tax=Acanthoscelides obtectus TaxID=200917 RepID=A0A9P0Q1J9_ACAOB|nr:unnamed protein product [Acanthoscelides obtectus]CAK1667125.1 hypothetical protein AOBTE_LOCUS25691 [Acanthoscelides obtectus]
MYLQQTSTIGLGYSFN